MSRQLSARLTLLFGVVALGLVVIPAAIYDQTPRSDNKAAAKADDQSPATGGTRINLKIKNFQLAFGKAPATAAASTPPAPAPPPNPTKPYRISAIIFALAGLAAGSMAWNTTRRGRPLIVTGVTLCCAAILWHYVIAGVVAAAGIAVLLLLLGAAAG